MTEDGHGQGRGGAGAQAQPPALHTQALVKAFGKVQAVQDVSLTVQRGETLALLGPSGCGKSTVLRLVAGLERPDSGQVHIGGRDVTALPPEARHVGLVFQDYALFPHLNVLDNVAYGPRRRGAAREAAQAQAQAALALVNLAELGARRMSQLSGGQQQRVALARALATASPLLLLDEPLSNLDEQLRAELRADLRTLFAQVGAGVLLVTHDQREALSLAGRVAIMRSGQVVQQGAAQEVFQRPASAWVAQFLGWANIHPAGNRVRLIPEAALELGAGQAWPVLSRRSSEAGEVVTVAHAGGPLTLTLSVRERAALAPETLSVHPETLRLQIDEAQVQTVPEDRSG